MFKNLMSWIEYRLPFTDKMNLHVMQYPAQKTLTSGISSVLWQC